MESKRDVWLILGLGFLWVFFSSGGRGEVLINEVMYAPSEKWGGSSNEWVELYNNRNDSFNLSGCLFYSRELEGVIERYGFKVIAREGVKFKEVYGENFSVLENSFERGLRNEGEKMVLEGKEGCADSFDYSIYINLAKGNNKTLERREEGSWGESRREGGTPGEENSIFKVSIDYEPLVISEVFPDPYGEDGELKPRGEWVELYNGGEKTIYLKGLVLEDESSHKLFVTDDKVLEETGDLFLPPKSYTVIYRDGDSDFTLNNNGYEEVKLLWEEEVIEEMSYAETTERMSWSRVEGNWYLAPPTPGKQNYLVEECDWFLLLELNNSIYREREFSFDIYAARFFGLTRNITVRGKIEDGNGEKVRDYAPWTEEFIASEKRKTYSPNLREGVYQISFWFEGLECQDQDMLDNKVTKLIAINPEYGQFDSSLEIEEIYLGADKSAEWGDQIEVKVKIHKGNESKSAVELWAEKERGVVSKRSKINIYEQFKEYTLTLPLQLEPNCHNKIEDGQVRLILEGLGRRAEKEFLVEGVDKEICRDYLAYVKELKKKEAKEKKKEEAYQVVELPALVLEGEVLRVKLQLKGDNKKHHFKAWSYLYKGNKCYSCEEGKEREGNLVSFELEEDEMKQAEMLVKVDEAIPEGEYGLKVKLNKDGQKTDKELTEKIYVKKKIEEKELNSSLVLLGSGGEEQKEEEGKFISAKLDPRKEKVINQIIGVVVYESSSEKAKKMIPYLILATLGVVLLMVVLRKI